MNCIAVTPFIPFPMRDREVGLKSHVTYVIGSGFRILLVFWFSILQIFIK